MLSLLVDIYTWSGAQSGANWATALGFPLGLGAAVIAVNSYLKSARIADDAHMHGLFRDYLQQRVDRRSIDLTALDAKQIRDLDQELRAVKYYVLEEMFVWLRRQWPVKPKLPRRSQHRMDHLIGWRETLAYHIRLEGSAEHLNDYQQCYGRDFLVFAAHAMGNKDLYELASGRSHDWGPLLPDTAPVSVAAEPQTTTVSPPPNQMGGSA